MSAIDEYLKRVDPDQRAELERIRAIAVDLLPNPEETIAYGMPTIKQNGKPVIGFDAHKNHIDIYPYSGSVISKIPELREYDQTKGAIREQLDKPLPKSLIQRIIHERLNQLAQNL